MGLFSWLGFFVGFVLCVGLWVFRICGWFGFLGRGCGVLFLGVLGAWFACFEDGGVPLRDHDPGTLFCPGRLFSFQAKIRV